MEYSLITYSHEGLRTAAKEVSNFKKPLQALLSDMRSIMNAKGGVGIAAPQVNASSRCFLVRFQDTEYTFVNPQISSFSKDLDVYEEGCLSVPGVYADVERPYSIHVKAQNEQGKFFEMDAEGYLARIIQHEQDHLDGVLFFDYLKERMQKRLLKLYTKLSHERRENKE